MVPVKSFWLNTFTSVKAVCIFFISKLVGQQKLLRTRVGVSLELAVWGAFMFFCTFSIDRMAFLQRNACIVSSVGFMRDDTSDRWRLVSRVGVLRWLMQVTKFCPLNVAVEHAEPPSSYSGNPEIYFPHEGRHILTLSHICTAVPCMPWDSILNRLRPLPSEFVFALTLLSDAVWSAQLISCRVTK
jgi:hypothetical protein